MYPIMFGGPAPGETYWISSTDGTYLAWFAAGDKEKDKLKEVLGWVDGFVKVTNLLTIN